MKRNKIPVFKKADLDATLGVFFDGFSKLIVAIAILLGTFGLTNLTVFNVMMPGLFLGVLVLNGGLWLYYRNIAKQRNDPNLTAIPGGLQAARIFIWLFSIMLPVYVIKQDAMFAFYVGVFAHFVSGIIFILGAYFVPKILKVVPSPALFGALAGGAMAFLILQSMDGILKMPLVGWISLIVLFVIYLGNVKTKLPAAFIAIAIGSIIAWCSGLMSFDNVTNSIQNLSFHLPIMTLGIFSNDVMQATIPFLPIIIVFTINEVITGIQSVEQAKECGDDYFEVEKPLVIAGVSSVVSSLFGNPLAFGLYWGYPGWKTMQAGTGYHLGTVLLYAIAGLTGLSAIINAFIPESSVLPILVFVGIFSYAQAFEVSDKKYFPAVIMASLPVLMDFIVGKAAVGAIDGFLAFHSGSAFIGIIIGCMFVFVIDNDWKKLAITNLVAMFLALIGMTHSPGIIFTQTYAPDKNFLIAYGASFIIFLIIHFIKFNQKRID